jgi:hypothetical protein
MHRIRRLRVLEGVGYVAAVMIGAGAVGDAKALRCFNVMGLVFAVIVILRLMVMNMERSTSDAARDASEVLGMDVGEDEPE